MSNHKTYLGDCLEIMKKLPDASMHSIVTDPPYGLEFMGKGWDHGVPGTPYWKECLRVLKPGGHLLAFSGSRTYHRMASCIEDAGFEIRDQIMWVYGQGFPKSHDVSKAIDKAAGAEREVVGQGNGGMVRVNKRNAALGYRASDYEAAHTNDITAPATDAAKQWEGWGTALKPAHEPICVARKPLIGTVAENVLAHGCGGINIDGCRIATDPSVDDPRLGGAGTWSSDKMAKTVYGDYAGSRVGSSTEGRFPANFIHDGSEEVTELFPNTLSGAPGVRSKDHETNAMSGRLALTGEQEKRYPGSGNASRFFYCAKANKKDRGTGNTHPTVKPTDLMRYLCRLVTPPNGIILDPFMGSGTTGVAALQENFNFVGIEQDAAYLEIARGRLLSNEQTKTEES